MSDNSSVFSRSKIVAFGEVLWDMLPAGPKLGGAPVNFLYHAHVLGAQVQALTRVGDDQLGREVLARFANLEIPTEFVQISRNAPTGVVNVSLSANGDPSYEIVENVAWDEIAVDETTVEKILGFLAGSSKSAFYYGSLALRSQSNRRALEQIVKPLPADVLRVCDLNLRPPFYSKETVRFSLESADVFKLNDSEAIELDRTFRDVLPPSLDSLVGGDAGLGEAIRRDKAQVDAVLATWARNWRDRFGLSAIIVTCGASGAYLFNGDRASYAPSVEVQVADAVGAGDSFSAVCVVGILNGVDDAKIVEAAAKRAAFVCSQDGATPPIPPEDANPF